MFKNLIDLATSTVKAADATLGLATKPVTDGAKMLTDSIEEILGEARD